MPHLVERGIATLSRSAKMLSVHVNTERLPSKYSIISVSVPEATSLVEPGFSGSQISCARPT